MRAVHADVVEQWTKRMEKCGADGHLFGFQNKDLPVLLIKNGVINGSKMGLGKTIETLMTPVMLTSKKCLLVVPSKLIGEWQDEMEKRLGVFVTMEKLNWRNERIKYDYQIIEWAKDVENLKTINIISYDKLWRTPRDAMFFVCPKCEFKVCNPAGTAETMPCPKCNHGVRKKWKAENLKLGLKKYVMMVDRGDGLNTVYLDALGLTRTTKDTRLPFPPMVMMDRTDHRYHKTATRRTGVDADGKPVVKKVKKKYHLRWSMAELLRNKFNFIGLDEALMVANDDSNRSAGIDHLPTV